MTADNTRPELALAGNDPFAQLYRWKEWAAANLGLRLPFHDPVEGIIGPRAVMNGRELLSFSSYNYLGYSGDPRVSTAAKEAIDRYGTSVSASRLVSGQKPLHDELEREIAGLLGTEACVAFTSGHATNVSTLSALFGPEDLVLYDALSHNSLHQGIRLSRARSLPFPHNHVKSVEALLSRERGNCRRALVVTEAVFSMDGDIAPIPDLVAAARRHQASVMVDEAHSMGVIGATGRGAVEHFGLAPGDVDLWMGTFSKTFASCGGYIAGRRETVEQLRLGAGGYAYSCGMTPPNAASALEAARLLRREPERVRRLIENADRFRRGLTGAGFDVGASAGTAIVPVILGNSGLSVFVAHALYHLGVLAYPLFFPVVPERSARLRFFVTAMHTPEDLDRAVETLTQARREAEAQLASLPRELLDRFSNFEGAQAPGKP